MCISSCPNTIGKDCCWKGDSSLRAPPPPHLLIELSWNACQKSVDYKCLDLFLNFQFYAMDLYVYIYASATLSRLLWLCSKFWNWETWVFSLKYFNWIFIEVITAPHAITRLNIVRAGCVGLW
jgi:hypothetical protein